MCVDDTYKWAGGEDWQWMWRFYVNVEFLRTFERFEHIFKGKSKDFENFYTF